MADWNIVHVIGRRPQGETVRRTEVNGGGVSDDFVGQLKWMSKEDLSQLRDKLRAAHREHVTSVRSIFREADTDPVAAIAVGSVSPSDQDQTLKIINTVRKGFVQGTGHVLDLGEVLDLIDVTDGLFEGAIHLTPNEDGTFSDDRFVQSIDAASIPQLDDGAVIEEVTVLYGSDG